MYRSVHGGLSDRLSSGPLPFGGVCLCAGASKAGLRAPLSRERAVCLLGDLLALGSLCVSVCLSQTGL